jgi:ABC-2 type transport system ATP-binding protein
LDEGKTLLLTTPYLDEAERCGRVALLNRGKILNLDTPANLRRSATGSVLEILAHPKRKAAEILAAYPGITEVVTFGEKLHVSVPSLPPDRTEALRAGVESALVSAGLTVSSVRTAPPSLEDVFISRIRSGESRAEEVPK